MVADASRSNRGGTPAAQRTRATSTRAAIVAAARELFAEAGYHATGTTEISARAAMTRGALYHHFDGKLELFEELFRTVATELVDQSNAAVAPLKGDLWPQVIGAFRQYLHLVAMTGDYRRILLIDGPVVLGWTRWRALQSEIIAGGIADALQMLMDAGFIAQQPAQPLANLILAALNDAALDIANSPQPSETSAGVTEAFLSLLSGLRTSG